MQSIESVATSFSLKNILLATDFSAGSQVALQFARGISHLHSSPLYAIHVTGPNSYQMLLPEPLMITFNQFSEASDNAPILLKALLEKLPEVAPVHNTGRIWEVIEDVVTRNEIDLLVVARHGRSGFSRLLHGSIAEELFRNISCPALVVGPEAQRRDSNDFQIKRILLGTDFDPQSIAPLYAAWLAREFNSDMTVVHVINEAGHTVETTMAKLRSAMEHDDGWAEPDLLINEPDFVIKNGEPATEILRCASEVNPDLIILGVRHPEPTKFVSHWPWDKAANVIASAKCPVLTVCGR